MAGEVKQINGKRVASTEYRSWQMMKNRCLNKKALDYKYYGGRGITICDDWLGFENFLKDMGRKPKGYTLERLERDGHYCPMNCIWASRKEQARNRDYCRLTLVDALQIRKIYSESGTTQKQIAKLYGVSQRTISLIIRNESWI